MVVPAPAQDAPAEVRTTHLSWVVLVGGLALKVLRPRRTAFVDQRSVAQRAAACAREVELNRRLAPDVYLGTSPLVVEGRTVEHLVVMRRLPASRSLSALVGTPELLPAVAATARTLAAFHAAQPPDPAPQEVASAEALRDLWDRSLDEVAAPDTDSRPGTELDDVRTLAHRWLDGRGPLLARRIEEGRVLDGHGDLLADDVFVLPDGPRLLDCLAFDDRLRRSDVLADLAFLAMDLERLAGPPAAAHLVRSYEEFSGARHPATLLHHYTAYRALVRAKIALLRAADGDVPGSAVVGRRLLGLCRDHLERGRVTLTLVGGGPGSGKSTLAEALATAADNGTVVVSTDAVRLELDGGGLHAGSTAPAGGTTQAGGSARTGHADHRAAGRAGLDEGRYSPAEVARTYAEALRRAEHLLGLGVPVVLDASWPDASGRAAARRMAASTSSDLVELCCATDPVTAAARVRRRRHRGDDPSEVDPLLVGALTRRRDPWPEAVEVTGTTVADALAVATAVPPVAA